jgi:hypothetical protein
MHCPQPLKGLQESKVKIIVLNNNNTTPQAMYQFPQLKLFYEFL